MTLHIDFETRSACDLTKHNAYVYAQHPTTAAICAAYAFGDGPIHLWRMGEPCPAAIFDHVMDGGEVAGWNVAFERLIWRHVMSGRYDWPEPVDTQYRCVMAESYAMNLPGKLEKAAPALGVAEGKDLEGGRLMLQMSKPRRIEPNGEIIWWEDADRLERLYAYCRRDVEVERNLEKRLLRLSPAERQVWLLDLKINDRGVWVDGDLCRKAERLVEKITTQLDKDMREVTDGGVGGVNSHSQLVAWLQEQGVDTKSVAAATLDALLGRDTLPPAARRALEIRKAGAKASTAKLRKMLALCEADGRMRGNIQYYGAAQTGRFAGRGAQLHNYPRPTTGDVKNLVDVLECEDLDYLEMMFGDPMTAVSDSLRSMISAAPGRVLLDADFSNIEGRGVAWLAGEETKLRRFREFDAGSGPDIYLTAAADIYNVPVSDAGPFRQVGKVAELALGFNGGPGAFAAMAANYRLDVAAMYGPVWDTSTPENRERALDGYIQRGETSGMSKEAWLAAECVKLAWRAAHPETVALWRGLEDAAIDAVRNPGKTTSYRLINYRVAGSFLFCQLPSRRALVYPYPTIVSKKMPWKDSDGAPVFKDAIEFKTENSVTRKWGPKDFYGGLATENVTQAVARDIMVEAMFRVEREGFEVILTVHDELLTETDPENARRSEFNALMAQTPKWAAGLPIAVSGWVGQRFRK